jgi:hypothetical protein
MLNVLDTCWIVIYCIYVCLYLFWRLPSWGGRQNKKFFLKKNPYVRRLTRRAGVAGQDYHVAFISIREPTNILQTWQLGGHGPMWLMFVDHAPPTNISVLYSSAMWNRRTCVLMFHYYVRWVTNEHSLCSSAINIYLSVFGR